MTLLQLYAEESISLISINSIYIETPKVNQTWMKTLSRSEEHSLELCKVPKVISDHVYVIFMHV